jgi:hypothetical protein
METTYFIYNVFIAIIITCYLISIIYNIYSYKKNNDIKNNYLNLKKNTETQKNEILRNVVRSRASLIKFNQSNQSNPHASKTRGQSFNSTMTPHLTKTKTKTKTNHQYRLSYSE